MLRRYVTPGSTLPNGTPFICRLIPFIGLKNPVVFPFVGRKIPFVRKKQNGFTLIELVITVTVIGIIAAVAVPGLTSFVESNRLTALTNDLIGDINLARSEALKRGAQIAICGSPTSTSCAAGTWNGGWRVFVDADGDGAWSSGDIQIKERDALPQNCSLTPAAQVLVINRMGAAAPGTTGIYRVCNSKIKKKRDIDVNALGRTNLTEGDC